MKAIVKAARSARKDVLPTSMGIDRAFRPLGAYGTPGSPAQMAQAINTYGGTDESSATVFACVSLIADTLAGYEWGITTPDGDLIPAPTPADAELFTLLDEPWPEATYNDFARDVQTDLELVGNSYWLKNNQNALLQPLELRRLIPANVKIITNKADEKIGYVYRVKGIDIPFGVEDVMQYRLGNPLHAHYGMGTVEAIMREIQSDLAQNAHVTAFFTNGARISGVLTIPEGMDEVQFERLKDEIASEYGSPENAYKILLAEKASDFKAITSDPKAVGVVDLRKLAKDSILQGFGVPEFLLGGTSQGGVPKMEQAQYVFYRRMVTRAQRFQDRTSLSLAGLWEGRKFVLFPELNEPPQQKIDQARGLAEACASPNEVRVAAGLPEIDDPRMDMPLLPTALSPLGIVFAGAQKPGGNEGQGGTEPNPIPKAHPFDGVKAPRRIRPSHKNRVHKDLKLPPGLPPKQALNPALAEHLTRMVLSNQEGVIDGTAVEVGQETQQEILQVVEQVERQVRQGLPAPASEDLLPVALESPEMPDPLSAADLLLEDVKLLIEAPELPDGYEQRAPLIDPGDADVVQAQQLLHGQANFFYKSTPILYATFVNFFNDQRVRVIERLYDQRSAHARNGGGKSLDRDSLWNAEGERQALQAAYLAAIDRLGNDALQVPARIVSASISWDVQYEFAAAAREALAEKVVRINETTREAIAQQVEEGVRRGYSIPRIANGYADENFKGIQGVFNEASAARAETIARTESGNLFNASAVAAYKSASITEVYVLDGIGDALCAEANGSVWTVDEANADPLGHPNCVRSFAPKMPGDN